MVIGEIILTALNYAPQNFLACNGQSVAVADYPELYQAIKNTYGGDATNFNVPDFRGKTPIGCGTLGAKTITLGEQGGQASITMSMENMPAHSHTIDLSGMKLAPEGNSNELPVQAYSGTGSEGSPVGNYPASYMRYGQPDSYMYPSTVQVNQEIEWHGKISLEDVGEQDPINNYQPALGLSYIICAQNPSDFEAVLGFVNMYTTAPPTNTMTCDGSSLSASSAQALFSILGYNYGGNGNNFNLPDLQGKTVVQAGGNSKEPQFSLGAKIGATAHSLSLEDIASHSHSALFEDGGSHTLDLSYSVGVSTNTGPLLQNPKDGTLAKDDSSPSPYSAKNNTLMAPAKFELSGFLGVQGSAFSLDSGNAIVTPIDLYSPYVGLNFNIITEGVYPDRAGDSPRQAFLGEIRIFAGNFVPGGWMLCDGRLLQIDSYQVLFSLLQNNFGGDGETTFALPDLTGRMAVGAALKAGDGGTLTLGEKVGTGEINLVENQLPKHTHTVQADNLEYVNLLSGKVSLACTSNEAQHKTPTAHGFASTSGSAGYTVPDWANGKGGINSCSYKIPSLSMQTSPNVGSAGSSKSIDMHMPSLGLQYIICTGGIFPEPPQQNNS